MLEIRRLRSPGINISVQWLWTAYDVTARAAESKARPELELVRVDRFGWSWSQSWSQKTFADYDSDPESQDTTRQQP